MLGKDFCVQIAYGIQIQPLFTRVIFNVYWIMLIALENDSCMIMPRPIPSEPTEDDLLDQLGRNIVMKSLTTTSWDMVDF